MKNLTRQERNWVLYDVGNSAFTMMTATVIPIYFKNIASGAGVSAADSTAYFSYASSLVTIIVAILGPLLGAVADMKGMKKNEKTDSSLFLDVYGQVNKDKNILGVPVVVKDVEQTVKTISNQINLLKARLEELVSH